MTRFSRFSNAAILSGLLGFGAAGVFGATSDIGFAVTSGTIRVNDSYTRKNASLFEGSRIETGDSASSLSLRGGAQVDLSVHSRGRVYGDRLVLDEGVGRITHARRFSLEAGPLRVVPDGAASNVSVTSGPRSIQITSFAGKARVVDTNGALLAMVDPGMTAIFAAPLASAGGAPEPGPAPVPDPGGQGGGGGGPHWALIFLGAAAATGAILGGLAAAGAFSSSPKVSVP